MPVWQSQIPHLWEGNSHRRLCGGIDGRKSPIDQIVSQTFTPGGGIERPKGKKKYSRKTWRRLGLEDQFRPFFPALSQGGELVEMVDRGKVLSARLSYENAQTLGWKDSRGRFLLNPRLRKTARSFDSPFLENAHQHGDDLSTASPLEAWYVLGLVDEEARPTDRGRIFSQFSRGEGLAIAVGLEDPTYPVEEMIYDLANLRAGHRFRTWAKSESRLAGLCRQAFGFRDCPGYLRTGLPLEYGEGGVDFIRERSLVQNLNEAEGEDLASGDVERLQIEWKSLLDLMSMPPVSGWKLGGVASDGPKTWGWADPDKRITRAPRTTGPAAPAV